MTRHPLDSVCNRDFAAVKSSGTRQESGIIWIVLHDEEASTAESAARFFTTPLATGSAHLCVDDTICYRCLPNTTIPQAAPGANTRGFHIEQAGFAKWSSVVWMSHVWTLRRAAYKTAVHCVRFNIPPRFVFASQLTRGVSGITTHAECTKAFGGDHTDPGPFWPRRRFMRLVARYHAELTT